jgi:hypothetical protein
MLKTIESGDIFGAMLICKIPSPLKEVGTLCKKQRALSNAIIDSILPNHPQ